MPIFLSDEEFARCSNDGALVAEKADLYIRELNNQLETVKAQADAASVTAEQTCSMLEQKYVSLFSEFTALQSENAQLNSSLEKSLSEIAQIQADKRQTYLLSIEKDGEIERLNMEASEFHKSKRQLLELLEQKDIEISEKNVTIKSYLDKIVSLTDGAATREARLSDAEAELARSVASCARLSQAPSPETRNSRSSDHGRSSSSSPSTSGINIPVTISQIKEVAKSLKKEAAKSLKKEKQPWASGKSKQTRGGGVRLSTRFYDQQKTTNKVWKQINKSCSRGVEEQQN